MSSRPLNCWGQPAAGVDFFIVTGEYERPQRDLRATSRATETISDDFLIPSLGLAEWEADANNARTPVGSGPYCTLLPLWAVVLFFLVPFFLGPIFPLHLFGN